MSNYSRASIYKILCDDGRFYIGSTILSLPVRFGQHRRAVEKGTNSKVYRHIRAIGGSDKSHIELVADNLGITTRDELLKIEDSYIREALKDKLCLNRNKPRATSEERLQREKLQSRMWTKINRDIRRLPPGADVIPLGERVREYYREHKRLPKGRGRVAANPDDLIDCECGWDVKRSDMSRHRKTKEHCQELMRWFFMKKILQRCE